MRKPPASVGQSCVDHSVIERIPPSLLLALGDLVKWLDAANVPSIIIGGVAASVLGRPRLTQDIDALAILIESDWARALALAPQHGIVGRIEDPLAFRLGYRILQPSV
jgi:hypothetical protein